jgi:hypothetical protein
MLLKVLVVRSTTQKDERLSTLAQAGKREPEMRFSLSLVGFALPTGIETWNGQVDRY